MKAWSSRSWWTKDKIWLLTVWALGGRTILWILQILIFQYSRFESGCQLCAEVSSMKWPAVLWIVNIREKKSQIENKSEFCLTTCKNRIRCMIGKEHLDSFTIRPLISRANQWTGFYTSWTSVMKELMLCYLHVFMEIYSLIMEK